MRKLVPLLALVAVPAAGQNAPVWQVDAIGRACTAVQPIADAESGRLSVTYDASRQEVLLTSANRVQAELPPNGTIDLNLVFLDNGREKYDDQWAKRRFTYVRDGDQTRFTTRFAGRENVSQILGDLGRSKRIGFLQKSGGNPMMAYFLDGLAPALDRLKECAARAATAS
jgi:hypothetical protein